MTGEKIQIPEDPQEGLPPVTPLDPEPFPEEPTPEDTPETKPAPEEEPEPAAALAHG